MTSQQRLARVPGIGVASQYRRLTRRHAIAVGALATAAGPVLAACDAPAAGRPAEAPAKGRVEVGLIAARWVIDEWGLPQWVEQYNKESPSAMIKLEQVPDGWQAKVLSMIREGSLVWDGVGIMTPFIDKVQWVESGMIQPIDQYVQVSTVDGAKTILGDLVPTVKQDVTYKGQIYGIPYSVEAIGLMWYTEYLGGIGLREPPGTWDALLDAAKKIQIQFRSQEVVPFAWVPAIHTSLQALIHAATDKPYTSEGLLDITGPASMRALRFMRSLVEEGLTPPHGSDGYLDLWQRSKLALLLAQNSRGVWAQRIFGPDKADTGPVPVAMRGGPQSGTPFWSNTFVVFNGAKHPQQLVDFYIWLLGPKNDKVQQAIIESGKAPVLDSIYKSKIENNQRFRWMARFRDLIAASVPYPENTFWSIQNSKIMPWINRLMEKGSTLSLEEAMNNALQEIREEVAKQKVR